jgi:glycosyltransferase involved in cell wall biosynthesis
VSARRSSGRGAVEAVFVEPFMTGSHAAFVTGWVRRSRHRWRVLSLPGERWRWRMRSAGWLLGERLARLPRRPAVVVASGLLDLAHLRVAGRLEGARVLLYLHENQLTYPRPPGEPLDRGFATAHLASVLAADSIAINSRFHRGQLVAALRDFLAEMPPPRPRGALGRVRAARVLPPGVDLAGFPPPGARAPHDPPVIAWNHRWEEDKRPSAFARMMLRLAERGLDFRLLLLGTTSQVVPRPLLLLREHLADRILRDRPAGSRAEYVRELARADIAVSTSAQENFGYAAIEAMAAGLAPLLPERLSYPEIVPRGLRAGALYRTDREALDRLAGWLRAPGRLAPLRAEAARTARRHGWERRVAALDDWVEGHA